MTQPIYKILLFLKRRPGMSTEDFRSYYETTHVKLCEKYAVGALRYVRRYLDPIGGAEMPFDVITEIWLEDRAVFDAVCEMTARNEPPPEVVADEERLFDRAKSRTCTVIERESDMEAVARTYA
jgi:hypothetical protein